MSNEYREKENLKQRECDAHRHSSTEFRQQKKLNQREYITKKRSSTEFRHQENVKHREYITKKRSSTEFREQENVKQREYITQKRTSTEFREQENTKEMYRKAQKRTSDEFREQENFKQREYITQKCTSTEFREQENFKQREYITQKRTSTEFREQENVKQREYITQKHTSTEFREQENVKQREYITKKRSSTEFREQENIKEKYRKAQKRTSDEFRDEENAQKQARIQTSIYGNNLADSCKIFLDAVSQGPIYVCSSCLQTQFLNNVLDVSTLHPGIHQSLLEECLTQYKSINGKEWLCLSCKREIYDGLVPKLSKKNKVGFPDKPPESDLNRLEEFFVAPLSAFMTIRSLPVCGLVSAGQKLMIGHVVYVVNDVGTTVRKLPHPLDDMDTIAVKIKGKKHIKLLYLQKMYALKRLHKH